MHRSLKRLQVFYIFSQVVVQSERNWRLTNEGWSSTTVQVIVEVDDVQVWKLEHATNVWWEHNSESTEPLVNENLEGGKEQVQLGLENNNREVSESAVVDCHLSCFDFIESDSHNHVINDKSVAEVSVG